MSADARVARAIIDVRRELDKQPVPQGLRNAIRDLIDEAKDALFMDDDDVERYR